jgi:putative transposase
VEHLLHRVSQKEDHSGQFMARVHHQADPWTCFHVTTRTTNGEFYLAPEEAKQCFVDTLAYRRSLGEFSLVGFVVMSNHVHFVIQPKPSYDLPTIVQRIKSWTSRNNPTKPPLIPMWERRFDDNRIGSEAELRDVLLYVHDNPVRAGICNAAPDYAWSSVHNFLNTGRSVIEIDTSW